MSNLVNHSRLLLTAPKFTTYAEADRERDRLNALTLETHEIVGIQYLKLGDFVWPVGVINPPPHLRKTIADWRVIPAQDLETKD